MYTLLLRLRLWWYERTLNNRFKKNDSWDINPTFIKTVVSQFNDEWLSNYNAKVGYDCGLVLYYLKLPYLISAIKDMTYQIKNDKEITLVSPHYASLPRHQRMIDYLVDEDNKVFEIMELERQLKKSVLELIDEMILAHHRSEIQYSYYQRVTKMAISDILEIYWGFFEVAKKTIK